MKNENKKNFLDLVSEKESGWYEKAKWREENEDWLDISFSITVKMLSALGSNKKSNTFPKNQKELAEVMGCSAQYVNKLLKGQENLQIETICKVQRILNISLIEVPQTKIKTTAVYEVPKTSLNQVDLSLWVSTKVLPYQNDEFEKANSSPQEYQLRVA